jgi:hypothetical protein
VNEVILVLALNCDALIHRRLVKAEPSDACSGLTPLSEDLKGAIIVATRGACGFGDKALYAQQAGASAVVIIDRPGSALLRIGATHDQVSFYEVDLS